MKDELNRTEKALALALALAAATRAGDVAREGGYPEPTPEQATEMGRLQTRAIVELVRGLRDPGPPATEDDLAQVIEGLAQGAVLRVLGASPAERENAN